MPLEPGQWVLPARPGLVWNTTTRVAMVGASLCSKFWLTWANTFNGYNLEALHDLVDNRPEGTPLLTVANHQSCLDDPCLLGAALKFKTMFRPENVRWCPGAADIAFTQKMHSIFFSLGQIVPIVRGDGVYQRAVDFSIEKMNEGRWVHFYPEGKVNMTNGFLRFKWGVGRVIDECKRLPIVLPFWHVGMEQILPNEPPYYPRIGKRVTMNVGKPIDLTEVLAENRMQNLSPMERRKAITDVIQKNMEQLKRETEAIHFGTTKDL